MRKRLALQLLIITLTLVFQLVFIQAKQNLHLLWLRLVMTARLAFLHLQYQGRFAFQRVQFISAIAAHQIRFACWVIASVCNRSLKPSKALPIAWHALTSSPNAVSEFLQRDFSYSSPSLKATAEKVSAYLA